MILYNYSINQSSIEQISIHLYCVSKQFKPPLNSYVEISEYSKKIKDNAFTFEAWQEETLVGLVACYLNNKETLEGYITNVSVIKPYKGNGIASHLLSTTIEKAVELGFIQLKLEVEVENERAIKLYKKFGFYLSRRVANKYEMISRLTKDK